MLLCRAAPLHIQCLVLVNDDDEVEEEDRESRRDCNSCWVQHNKRREICLYYERMTSRREDGGRDASLFGRRGAFSRLVLMRVYCRSGRLRCGRFWMAFQQCSKLGLKGQGVSRVTPSGVGSHTTTYVARAESMDPPRDVFGLPILGAHATVPPAQPHHLSQKNCTELPTQHSLSACTYRPSHSRPQRSTLCSTTHTSTTPLHSPPPLHSV